MRKFTTFLLALLLAIPAMAATITGGTTFYLKPNSNWTQANARFAMYLCNGSSTATWVDMTLVESGVYQGVVPAGQTHQNVIFCRMNPSSTSNNWNNKWNQTGDLTWDGSKNCCSINSGQWDCGTNVTWSTYTPSVKEELTIPDGIFSYNEGELAVFFVNTPKWTAVSTHIWGDGGSYSTTWPGTAMTKLDVTVDGTVNKGYTCYKWSNPTGADNPPTGIIIMNTNNTDNRAGGDLTFVNGGVYDGDGTLLKTIEPTPVVVPTITLILSEPIYVGDNVTLSSSVLNGEGYTVKYFVNDVETGETWTPDATGEYTIVAKLMNGENVVASDSKTVTVNAHTYLTFTVTVPAGTTNVNIAGSFNDWSTTATPMNQVDASVFTVTVQDVDKETVQYKYVTNQSWDNEEVTETESPVSDRNYTENDVVAKWKGIALPSGENIECESKWYLNTNGIWTSDNAWFAAYFFNKNTNQNAWVKGELIAPEYYVFYLSQYNVPEYAAAPARAMAEEAPVYTHVIFCRMNPDFNTLSWDVTEEVDNGDGSTTTNVLEDHVWNQTADLTWDGSQNTTFQITTAEGEGNWEILPTAVESVKVANGIVYANGVVTAEGAIEVYNVGGAVVARGNNNVDLNGLNGGVYIVRNGNNVCKVVR